MNRKGSVLILFLWILILFGLFSISVGFRMRIASKIEGFQIEQFQTEYDFLSGVNLGRYFIDSDMEPKVDFLQDIWYGVPLPFQGLTFSETFDLEIEDEESKIDLNQVPGLILAKLFEILKKNGVHLDADPNDMTAGILAWRGKTIFARGKPTSGFDHKRGAFESLGELPLVQYISFSDSEKIRPFVTVYGSTAAVGTTLMRLNINTAHPYVLEALVLSLPGGDLTKRELLDAIDRFRNGAKENSLVPTGKQVLRTEDLRPETFMEKLNLTTSIAMTQLVGQFLAFATVDSQYFRIRVQSRPNHGRISALEAVVGPRTAAQPGLAGRATSASQLGAVGGKPVTTPLELLEWHEYSMNADASKKDGKR